MMTTQDDIRRRAQIAAIDTRLNTLIFGIPLAAVAGMAAYGMAGGLGIGAVALLSISQVRKTHRGIQDDREAIAKDDRATLIKYTPKGERATLREVYAAAVEQPAPTPTAEEEPTTTPPPQAPAQWQPATFSRNDILASGTGIIVMGEGGSGKSTLCRYVVEGLQSHPLLVLDPHFDPDRNPWGDGVKVIRDKAEILHAMEVLLRLLDEGDRRPLAVIVDEVPSIRIYADSVKSTIANEFIIRFGSECRKFNKLALLGSQSGNVRSLGLEGQGDFLMNYTQIALGKIAVKRLRNSTARDAYQWSQSTGYPVLIDDHIIATHPNLGKYPRRSNDNLPEGLGTISPPPLYPDVLARVVAHHTTPPPPTHGTPGNTPTTPQHTEENCPHCGSSDTIANGTTRSGIPRRRCKSCGKTWGPPTPPDPLVWGV
jgi:hypothetical protein